MASTETKAAVLRSFGRRPGQTLDEASREVGKVKSTVHAALQELQADGLVERSYCDCCGAPGWIATEGYMQT